ncbi:MAG: CHAT domain-containing tetratricopeptide repeat protein [Planctomycetota bacterium]
MRRVVLCVLSCALAGPVFAGDAPPAAPAASPNATPTQVAGQAALDAFTSKDAAALAALAARDEPDPWLVAEDLLRRGAGDAAVAFAAAAPRADVEALPAYVAARRAAGDDAARRTRVATAQAALTAGNLDAALEALGPAEAPPLRDVPGVQLQQLRGLVLARQQRPGDAAIAMAGAVETAEALGWLARAAMCADLAARLAFDGRDLPRVTAALERQHAVATKRGDRRGAATALSGLGFAAAERGDKAAAIEAGERALAAWQAAGEPRAAEVAREELGARLVRFGELERAAQVLEEAVLGFRTLGDRGGLAQALVDLGDACAQAGAVERAVKAWEEARSIYQGAGDVANELPVLIALGRVRGPGPQRDDAKALEALTRALKLAGELGDVEAEAVTASRLGNLHALRAEKADARAMYERELALRERLGDERALAAALIDAGQRFTHGLMCDEQVAGPWLERGRVLAEKLGEPRWVVNALLHGADLALELARPAEAVTAYERALAASKAAGLPETEAAAHLGIGNARLQQRDAPAALAAYELALAGFEQSGNRFGQAVALEQSAKAHALRPAHAQAVAAYQRAIEVAKPTGDAVFLAGLLRGLGRVQMGFGDAQKALAALEYALKLSDSRDDRVGASDTLLVLGVAYRQLGRYVLSLDATERARALQLELGDRRGAAMTLCNLGVVYWDLGQIEKALGMYERALVDLEAVQDRDSVATTLGNLGATHERLGDPAQALEQHARALAIWEALKDQGGAGRVRIAMALCHLGTGELDRALELAERGFADLEASGDKRGAVSAQVVLGRVLEKRGATAKALQAFERGARGAEKLGATAVQVEALGALAATRLRAGDAGRAVSEAHRAVELMKTLVGGLGEEQSASVRGEYTELFSTGLRAAARVGDVAEAAFFLESGRAGALLDALQVRDSQRWAGVPEALRQAEAEARADEARALAAWSKASDGDDRAVLRALRADLDAARAKVAQAVERIQREAKKASRLAYPVATPVEDLQALLGDGEALVLYGLAKGDDPAHGLVLTRDDARIVELGKTSAIVEACEALHADDPSSDPASALERLRALLVAPLGLAEGTRRLLVSPDGALGYVPFAALVVDLELAYVASGSTYGVLREERTDPGTKVLALGDPDYQVKFDPTALELYAPAQRTGSAPIVRGGRLTPLPGTRAEATAVGDVTLLGKDASEGKLVDAVLQHGGRWRAIHFACHGLVDPDRPSLSSLALTPDGANDGFLTVLEVLRMDLRADLAVLSACETGRGKVVSGEGIVGLTRAFMFAGSPSVLCSLWKVDDAATAALMKRFYELWNPKDGSPGKSPAAALREAQAFVRAQPRWKHPYYWAAWVLWGLPT